MIAGRRLQPLLWIVLVVAVVGYTVLAIVAVRHGNTRLAIARRDQAIVIARSDMLRAQVAGLENENRLLRAQLAAAVTQANASVGQLTAAGQKPIIAAPGIVTVPPAPDETTSPLASPPAPPASPPTTAAALLAQTPGTTSGPPPSRPVDTTTTAPEPTTTTTTTAPPVSTTSLTAPIP